MLDGDILVDILRVERGVDDCLARWHAHAETGEGKAAPDAEDHVGFCQEPLDWPRIGPAAAAERERMVLTECALTLDRRGHWDVPRLGERPQLRPRLGPVHPLARVDDRPRGTS